MRAVEAARGGLLTGALRADDLAAVPGFLSLEGLALRPEDFPAVVVFLAADLGVGFFAVRPRAVVFFEVFLAAVFLRAVVLGERAALLREEGLRAGLMGAGT